MNTKKLELTIDELKLLNHIKYWETIYTYKGRSFSPSNTKLADDMKWDADYAKAVLSSLIEAGLVHQYFSPNNNSRFLKVVL